MKSYWDLSERERAALTAESVEAFLDVERMVRGAVKPAPPQLEPLEDVALRTRSAFVIRYDDYHRCNVAFETADDARAFLALKPLRLERLYPAGVDAVLALALGDPSIAEVQLPDGAEVEALSTRLKVNRERKERNDAASAEYARALNKYDEALTELRDDLARCQMLAREHAQVHATWLDYVRLADGDRDVAWKFLVTAFGDVRAREAFAWHGTTPPPDVSRPAVAVAPEAA